MAIKIVSFPINSMVIFQFAMSAILNYQRVVHSENDKDKYIITRAMTW